jgi:oxygen-independent coproporphyrinogen-3 oxidase
MEERTDIVGIGAGSSTKLVIRPGVDGVTEGTRIDRVENCKSVDDYINRIDEMIDRKKKEFLRVRV